MFKVESCFFFPGDVIFYIGVAVRFQGFVYPE